MNKRRNKRERRSRSKRESEKERLTKREKMNKVERWRWMKSLKVQDYIERDLPGTTSRGTLIVKLLFRMNQSILL